ncbi:MAG: pyridoxamine 5'-phosphate oxidase family protein [Opitutaceae bacterium]|nr:pyridoxamine 5'-phosphate oxidase family protein [Opitutaceae bacterium]
MKALPEIVRTAWVNREGSAVFATVDTAGMPNAIYVGCIGEYGDDIGVMADNNFYKTRANIHAGSRGTLLFITDGSRTSSRNGSSTIHPCPFSPR